MAEKGDIKYVDLNGFVHYDVKVGGESTGYAQYITSISTTMAFNKISTLEITFQNAIVKVEKQEGVGEIEYYVSDEAGFDLDEEVELSVGYDKAEHVVFKGLIVKRSIGRGDSFLFTILAKHEAEKMTKDRVGTCHESKSVGEIIDSICGKYNIPAQVENPGDAHECLNQEGYSDWDFINLIAEAESKVVFTTPQAVVVKQIDADTLVNLLSGDPVLDIVNGYNINGFNAELDNRYSHKIYNAVSFNPNEQEQKDNSSSSSNVNQSEAGKGKEEECRVHSASSMRSEQEENKILETLSVRNDLAFLTGTLDIVGYAPLLPGDVVCIHKMGRGYDGKVLVSSVTHSIRGGKWSTCLKIGFENLFYAERYDNIAPQTSMGMLPSRNGLLIAKVESLAGDPKGMNRIYVRLLTSNDMKLWCRVATLDAGNKRGSFFMPEKEDEVIVGFVDGNPNDAVILGMLYSEKSPAPLEITDENHVKGFFSRENIQLLFDDEKKAFSVETPGGNKLIISDDEKGISLEDQNGNTIVMNDQGITIESKKALTLKAAQDVSIEGTNVNIKANAQLVAQGSASAEVSAGGNTVIKGGLVQIN